MRDSTSSKNILNRLLYDISKDLDTPALQYGRIHEELALQAYEKHTNTEVNRPVGLVVHPAYPFLAATPDGTVDDEIIVEVKCPKRAEEKSLQELAAKPLGGGFSMGGSSSSFFLDEKLLLKTRHNGRCMSYTSDCVENLVLISLIFP